MNIDDLGNISNLIYNLPLGIFTVNLNMEITFFNKEAENLTGFSKEEAFGCKCFEIFRAKLCNKCFLKHAIEKGISISHVRNSILTKDDREVPVVINCSPIRDKEGNIIGGMETFYDDTARVSYEKILDKSSRLEDVVTRDEKMKQILSIIEVAATTDFPVLLTGETGTGKDHFARLIHNTSNRKRAPFAKINCAALHPNLIESELFGYKKGAFTDAKADKMGRFNLAEGGTIYLDEIGELPLELQAKLLQVLEEKEFYPLGATKPVKVNVRVISSTNRDIRKMVEQGGFRKDLFYRLNIISLEIPPLRQRPSDIPLLLNHFLSLESKLINKNVSEISKEAYQILMQYSYPGNVRELKNIIKYACAVCKGDKIEKSALPPHLFSKKHQSETPISPSTDPPPETLSKETIISALHDCQWRRKEAAKKLNINRSTLWRKMKKYGLI